MIWSLVLMLWGCSAVDAAGEAEGRGSDTDAPSVVTDSDAPPTDPDTTVTWGLDGELRLEDGVLQVGEGLIWSRVEEGVRCDVPLQVLSAEAQPSDDPDRYLWFEVQWEATDPSAGCLPSRDGAFVGVGARPDGLEAAAFAAGIELENTLAWVVGTSPSRAFTVGIAVPPDGAAPSPDTGAYAPPLDGVYRMVTLFGVVEDSP